MLAVLLRLTGLFSLIPHATSIYPDVTAWQIPVLLFLFALLAWSRQRGVQVVGLILILVIMNSVMSREAVEIPRDRPSGTTL